MKTLAERRAARIESAAKRIEGLVDALLEGGAEELDERSFELLMTIGGAASLLRDMDRDHPQFELRHARMLRHHAERVGQLTAERLPGSCRSGNVIDLARFREIRLSESAG